MNARWATVAGMTSLWILVVVPTAVFGQRTNYAAGSTSNGLFGQTTVGGNSTIGSANTPTSAVGSNTGSTSNSNSVQSATGMDTTNIALTAQQLRPTVQTTQQRGAFVGADSADTTNARSLQGLNTRNQSGNNGLLQLQNLFQQGMQNINQGNQQGAQLRIPVSLKLGFTPQPVSNTRVAAFQTRLSKIPSVRFMGPASVTMEGRTAVLRGTVATAEDRELAEALTLMEPDVLKVRNELKVDSSATTAEELPPASAPQSTATDSP